MTTSRTGGEKVVITIPHQEELFPPEVLAQTVHPPTRWVPFAEQLKPSGRGMRPQPRHKEVRPDHE